MEQTQQLHYLERLKNRLPLGIYIPRRFAVADEASAVAVDMDRFRGMLRDREPELQELLNRRRVLILAEPGGGKSIVARAAVHQLIKRGNTVPIFVEMKEYRGKLNTLVHAVVSEMVVKGSENALAFIIDGIDEIPREYLKDFNKDIDAFMEAYPNSSMFATARQAFYVANKKVLPPFPNVFHLLDFSDKDIISFVEASGLDKDRFLSAVNHVDAHDEIRNPFILSIMVEQFRATNALKGLRSENLSYMVDRLILSRPLFNQHRQRRALRMIAVAMETYSRNELTESEAYQVIVQSMKMELDAAKSLLDELNASILKRTANGVAFQMKSYGEYLAAEALEDATLEKIRELAFVEYATPNESWRNTLSYLAELNPEVRILFVHEFPEWIISISPGALTDREKDVVLTRILESAALEGQLLTEHPNINLHNVARLLTEEMEPNLASDLESTNEVNSGNSLMILGVQQKVLNRVIPIALALATDQSKSVRLRHCGIVALINAGDSTLVPALIEALKPADPLHMNMVDTVGALCSAAQFDSVLPLILGDRGMLSATYYRFREFNTKDSLIQLLRYFVAHPNELNSYHAESYVEPILQLMDRYLDLEIAELCAELIVAMEGQLIYPDQSGPIPKIFRMLQQADKEGMVAKAVFERWKTGDKETIRRIYYLGGELGTITTKQTAEWLVEHKLIGLIKGIAPFTSGTTREVLRAHSGGIIDAQEDNAKYYQEEEARRRHESEIARNALIQQLLERTSLNDVLNDCHKLGRNHWPDLPPPKIEWLNKEISHILLKLDLPHSVIWKDSTLWQPVVLSLLLDIVSRYALKIEKDEFLLYAGQGISTEVVAEYFLREGLSQEALAVLDKLFLNPPSDRALESLISLVDKTGTWTPSIQNSLESLVRAEDDKGYLQTRVLHMLVRHGFDQVSLDNLRRKGASEDLRQQAFEVLVEQQHRPTIERGLSKLLSDSSRLASAEVRFPSKSDISWIGKIRDDFAWGKLSDLRAKALQSGLGTVVGIITNTLANIDRARTAKLIREQIASAPESWRAAQISNAISQESDARIEAAQQTPFENVIRKLKGNTSFGRLKLYCEGQTDIPVFRELLHQCTDVPDVLIDSVGGWNGLKAKDPELMLLGAKAVAVVMDGDNGRHLSTPGRPLTATGEGEMKRLTARGIKFYVLERYGIENYFPQRAIEKIVGRDLSKFFPIPESISVEEHLSLDRKGIVYRFRKWAARRLSLGAPTIQQPLYKKSKNAQLAQLLVLDRDLGLTDLCQIIRDLGSLAKQVAG